MIALPARWIGWAGLVLGALGCDERAADAPTASPSASTVTSSLGVAPKGDGSSASEARSSNAAAARSAAPNADLADSAAIGASSAASGSAEPSGSAAVGGGACPAGMAFIGGGTLSTIKRGSDVEVAPFCIDLDEVSVAQFRKAVEAGRVKRECATGAPCPAVPVNTEWGIESEDRTVSGLCNGRASDREDHPINCVSFGEAAAYCAASGNRLPTGDEWEWAAKSGPARRANPWGSAVVGYQICWGKPKKRGSTCPLGSFDKTDLTAQGVKSMGGSLTEWTTRPKRDGRGEAVWAYGASWYAIDDGYVPAVLGGVQMPAARAETVGFRCAR